MNKISIKSKLSQEEIISEESFKQFLQSYLGILKHCEGYKLEKRIREKYQIAGFLPNKKSHIL
jgi:hypothetical protein